MFVMTVDQRKSTGAEDLIPRLEKLTEEEAGIAFYRPFQRTAGDEAQAVFKDPQALLTLALRLSREGNWHLGLGAGAVNQPLPAHAREGSGEAYINARKAVERAKKSTGNIAYEGPGETAGLIEAGLQLIMDLEEERRASWQQVGELADAGYTQQEIAEKTGSYQSAVSRSLKQGRWYESRRLLKELAALLEREA